MRLSKTRFQSYLRLLRLPVMAEWTLVKHTRVQDLHEDHITLTATRTSHQSTAKVIHPKTNPMKNQPAPLI